MSTPSTVRAARLLLACGALILVSVAPAHAQGQPVGPGMVGGPPPCYAGSNPALFDTDGIPGPSGGDQPAYFQIVTASPLSVLVRSPREGCDFSSSNQVTFSDSGANNLWPGKFDGLAFNYGLWTFHSDQQEGTSGPVIGGTFSQVISTGVQTFNLSLLSNGAGAYDRVAATGGPAVLEGQLLGWDLDGDGVDDYVGLSWSGMGAFNPCPGNPVTDVTMLWVPVLPYGVVAGRSTAPVRVAVDMNCDGVEDTGFPPTPPLLSLTVPVELQSFTVASVLPTTPRGLLLSGLAALLVVGVLALLRGRFPGLDV